MEFVKHLIIKILGLVVILGIPSWFLVLPTLTGGEGVDVVSSATQISADDVSGEYVVLINEEMHRAKETTDDWAQFFLGESPLIFDDISCLVASNDGAGKEFAGICQARLPENQMKISDINGLLMVSKAEAEKFDVIIMSKEFAESYSAEEFDNQNIRTVYVSGE